MIPGTTLAHAAESEARPEKTHASFKVVLPNLRQGCALWRKIAMQKADAAPMGQKKHHRRLHHGSEKKKHHSRDNFGSNKGTCCRFRSAARRNTRFIQSGAAKPAPRLCAWRNTARQKADAAPMGQKKHHPCGVRTRSPATTRSPAKRNNWIAAMHLLKAKTICFHCTETSLSQFHFGMLPLRIMVFTVFPEPQIRTAFLLGSASVRIRMGHVLCSCKIFRTKIASAATRCFLKHSHSATLSPRASSKSIAFSGGGSVLVRHRCVEAALREHARQRLQSQAPVLHFSGAMPAGSCLFAMAVTVAGRKTTPPERGCLHTVSVLCYAS